MTKDDAKSKFKTVADRCSALSVLLILFSLIVVFPVQAQVQPAASSFSASILIAGSDNPSFNIRFTDLLNKKLDGQIEINAYSDVLSQSRPNTLVVALGSNALARVQQQTSRPATLALMVEEDQFASYLGNNGQRLSAVYYDAPLLRQAFLGKLILPGASQVALLARPGHETRYDEFIEELKYHDLQARVFTVTDEDSLIATLARALSYGDFLLADPDPAIYNPRTIKHILLTAYRRNRIVIGPGRAFVRAGVLASTYTPLESVADAAAEQIRAYMSNGELPPPFHPASFEVEVNRQVADSLNIPIPDTGQLVNELMRLLSEHVEGGHP